MSKAEFVQMFIKMYRVGNLADSDNENREEWTHVDMAGKACCRPLDHMARELVACGVLSDADFDAIYSAL